MVESIHLLQTYRNDKVAETFRGSRWQLVQLDVKTIIVPLRQMVEISSPYWASYEEIFMSLIWNRRQEQGFTTFVQLLHVQACHHHLQV